MFVRRPDLNEEKPLENLYARTCLASLSFPTPFPPPLHLAEGWRLLERKNVRVVVIARISCRDLYKRQVIPRRPRSLVKRRQTRIVNFGNRE